MFFARYAQQYVPELFSRKSILKLANSDPLMVDENVPVAELAATLLAENPDALIECFVVTRARALSGRRHRRGAAALASSICCRRANRN